MFSSSRILFIYAEQPVHAGAGTGLGAVDLPIQRERITGYPIIQSSGVKGALRSEAKGGENEDDPIVNAIFGPHPKLGSPGHAGALSPSDAKILCMPVRSLSGVFAYVTGPTALARFVRDGGCRLADFPGLPDTSGLGENDALVSGGATVVQDSNSIVLEEFTFAMANDPGQDDKTTRLAEWLAQVALPAVADGSVDLYHHWRRKMADSLVILPDNAFRDFCQHGTEVATRVQLDTETKTVAQGPWFEEYLPADTLLYSTVHASRLRLDDGPEVLGDRTEQADKVMAWISNPDNLPQLIQIGGNETVGRGLVRLTWQSLEKEA